MDAIWGEVTRVLDGDTFDVAVTHYEAGNRLSYGSWERIRINALDAPELGAEGGVRARARLEARLLGRRVRLAVRARDAYGRLLCDVTPA